MRHSLESRSGEYCCCGSTALPFSSCAVRSCPGSDEYAGPSDIAGAKALRPQELPDGVFAGVNNPKAGLSAHRKRPTSVEYRVDGCKSQATDPACLSGTSFDHAEAESPRARTDRKQSLGHLVRDSSHIDESVFFSLKSRIVAFFPRFGTPKFDLSFTQNAANRLQTDRIDNTFLAKVFSKLLQRPTSKWPTQKVRWTQGGFNDEASLFLGKFRWSAGMALRLEGFQSTGIELLDDGSDVLGREIESGSDLWDFRALVGSKDDLGTAYFNPVAATVNDALKFFTLRHAKVANVETHGNPP